MCRHIVPFPESRSTSLRPSPSPPVVPGLFQHGDRSARTSIGAFPSGGTCPRFRRGERPVPLRELPQMADFSFPLYLPGTLSGLLGCSNSQSGKEMDLIDPPVTQLRGPGTRQGP